MLGQKYYLLDILITVYETRNLFVMAKKLKDDRLLWFMYSKQSCKFFDNPDVVIFSNYLTTFNYFYIAKFMKSFTNMRVFHFYVS